MKRVAESIEVTLKSGRPHHLRWRNRRYPITEIRESWVLQGRWWSREEKRYYFVVGAGEAVLQIYRSPEGWFVSKVYD